MEASEEFPWVVYKGLHEQLATQGWTLMAGELMFVCSAVLCLVHALSADQWSVRWHVAVWIAALTSGVANDLFFMALEFVDNFFHAQCTVMLTPRLPLYIPCVYIVFVYVACIAGSRCASWPPYAQAAFAALTGSALYYQYDMVGAKFLWWSWHDTDAGVYVREYGVPLGSTVWTVVHCFVFTLIAVLLKKRGAAAVIATCTAFTTPLMMMVMGVAQLNQLDLEHGQRPGKPDVVTLGVVYAVVFAISLYHYFFNRSAKHKKAAPSNARLLFYVVLMHAAVMCTAMLLGTPEEVIATGVHQTRGECYVTEIDPLSGYSRFKYLCDSDFDEDFRIQCEATEHETSKWYTLCGQAHTAWWSYGGMQLLFLAVNAILAFESFW